MIKKTISLFVAISVFVMLFALPVAADTRSSAYIMRTSAILTAGTSNGKIQVNYNITGRDVMTTIGASKIVVYRSNGTVYATYNGSVANGLLVQNSPMASGTQTIYGVSGTTYYCKVTLYAGDSSGSDSRTIITGTVTAP